jgi:hypothetical protein
MKLEIFELPDPSGKLNKESYLFKNHREQYDYIIDFCQKNGIFDIPFKQKVYLCLYKISKVPTCKNPNCDKKVNFINSTLGFREYCSKKCISSDPNIKKIKELKSLDKFGTKTPAESKLIKDKIIQTNQEKYGGNSPMSSEKIKEKSKEKLIKNWGVDNPSKSREILDRRVKSFKNNIEQYKNSYKETSLLKYGTEHPWSNKEIHNKSIEKSKENRRKNLKRIVHKMLPMNYKFLNICYETGEAEISCNNNHIFKATRNFIYNRWRINSEICTLCNPLNSPTSGAEISLSKFIENLTDVQVIVNERSVISPFEVDIYLPELKLGFEYNGLWWHSSEFREYDYHVLKQKKSLQNGIKIITIWEDEWLFRQEAAKSFISSKLGKISNRIYARSCQVKEVDKMSANNFLEINHLIGKTNSSVRVALEYENEIVSIVTFIRNNNEWELNRFCNKNFTRVIGGFSKILKYFEKKYKPKFIMTYSDNMQSDGSVYQKNGFKMVEELSPSYTILMSKRRVHRLKNLDGQNLPKIYNAGNKKWILNFESE